MDFQKAVELSNKSNNILLTTHTRPDGDACGCIAALAETLRDLGKNTKILLLSELPQWYEFLFEQKPEIFGERTKIDADLTIIADTNTYNQLPGLEKYLKQTDKAVLVIDHHATPESSVE